MAVFRSGYEFGAELQRALGLVGRSIRRIVIDVEVRSAVLVYVEEFFDGKYQVELFDVLEGAALKSKEIHPDCVIEMENGRPVIRPLE